MNAVMNIAHEPSTMPAARRRVDQEVLAEWFCKWRKPIRGWLSRRCAVPASDLDDLTQEVFLRVLRYSELVDNPQGYLYRIAANVANEWRERSRIKNPHAAEWLEPLLVDEEHEPERVVEHEWLDAHVSAVVDTLPCRQRQILLMHVYHGLTYKQTAKQLGITYRTVLRELTRAYSALRAKLDLEVIH